MKKTIIGFGLFAAISISAKADFFTGNILMEFYPDFKKVEAKDNNANHQNAAMFQGYVTGAIDTLMLVNKICIPKTTTSKQVISFVGTYLEKHPEELNLPAEVLVYWALAEHFPCNMAK